MRISDWSSDVCSSDLRLMGERPFPIMRFIAQWLRRNVPQDRTRATFVNFDAGQFLYEDDRVTGLIDFEVSSFGDPAAELSGLRLRDAAEPLGDLSAMIDRYEMLTGEIGRASCRERVCQYV